MLATIGSSGRYALREVANAQRLIGPRPRLLGPIHRPSSSPGSWAPRHLQAARVAATEPPQHCGGLGLRRRRPKVELVSSPPATGLPLFLRRPIFRAAVRVRFRRRMLDDFGRQGKKKPELCRPTFVYVQLKISRNDCFA